MIIKLFLLLLPLVILAKELIWSSHERNQVSKETYDVAIKFYVDKKYPQKAKAYRDKLFKKMKKDEEEEIRNNTVVIKHLMWQDDKNAKLVKRSWYSANRYCTNLRLFGFSDWQLPSVAQFKNIISKKQRPTIDAKFKNTANSYYWSSTSSRSYSKDAWRIDFRKGSFSHYYKANDYYVRCVREEK